MNRHVNQSLRKTANRGGLPLFFMGLLLTSCIREEFNLNENSPIVGDVQPSWAVPLGQVHLQLNDHWDVLDSLQIEPDEVDGMLQFVQPFEVFSSAPLVLDPVQEDFTFDWLLDEAMAQGLSSFPAGESDSFGASVNWSWGVSEMSSLDSLWLSDGDWNAQVTSHLPMDLEVRISTDNILANGAPLELFLTLDYTGTLPVVASESVSLDGRSVHFLNGTDPLVPIDWEVEWLGTGEEVNAGEALEVTVSIADATIDAAFGAFATDVAWPFEMGQSIPVMEGFEHGSVHFADPQIHLWMSNSSGIPVGVEWEELAFVQDGITTYMTGPDIEDFPIIASAGLPGEDAETYHVIDNSGTTPSLTSVMDAMPDSMHLNGAISINPEGSSSHFILETSRIALEGELRLPMNGWASALQWNDTLDVDISEALEEAVQPPLDWQDVAAVTMRLRCENALPVGVRVQAIFLNGFGIAIESAAVNGFPWTAIEAGSVSNMGSPDAPGFGRVLNPEAKNIDWVLDREMAQDLIGQDCRQVVVLAMMETTDAANNQDVRFYPEDGLLIELGVRVDFDITWNP